MNPAPILSVERVNFTCGRYQDVLHGTTCDAVIVDPPFSERTHAGQRHNRKDYSADATHTLAHRGLSYAHWTESDVREFVEFWHPRAAGWVCVMTSHDLVPLYSDLLNEAGRYVFAPVPCVQMYMNVRLAGDGPSNWTAYLVVARPKGMKNGALPGAYVGKNHDAGENTFDRSKRIVPGGKPTWLMSAIVRDYSRPGDLICDPCAGGGTTLIAAMIQGRRAIGAEMDRETFRAAAARIQSGYTPDMLEFFT